MARQTYVDLSNSIEAWRQKCNLTSQYIGDLDQLKLASPYDATIVSSVNHLYDEMLDSSEVKNFFTVIHNGPTTLSSLTYNNTSGVFTYSTVELQATHIPDLDASKITSGQFNTARIPFLDASKIASGVLDVLRIPDLDASKITTGQISANRVPPLDASKITTGTIDVSLIPTIPADKIGSGSGGSVIGSSQLDPDIMYKSQIQTVSGQKTFTSNLIMNAAIFADADNTRDIGQSAVKFRNVYGHTFHGTATKALYADLAEKYLADNEYEEGIVVAVGGSKEITIANQSNKHSIIGVISTNPGFILNSELDGGSLVALKGRVPVRVIGEVQKGDRLVLSDIPGHLTSDNHSNEYIAVSLESGSHTVEAIIR